MTALPANRSGLTGGKARTANFKPAGTEVKLSFSPAPAATVTPVTVNGLEYLVAKVTASTTLSVQGAPALANADIIVVGGGGSGGSGNSAPGPGSNAYGGDGGGGGSGGLIKKNIAISNTSYPISIGGGGANTTAFSETALAGGNGGPGNAGAGTPGGSGGGCPAYGPAVGSGTAGQGTPGAFGQFTGPIFQQDGGAGGGGLSGGGRGSRCGAGIVVDWPNVGPYDGVAGGGSGGNYIGSAGGSISFGAGATRGASGTANTGGGGSGGSINPPAVGGGSGGSGVVYFRVLRYQ